jgi:hypothetical protein
MPEFAAVDQLATRAVSVALTLTPAFKPMIPVRDGNEAFNGLRSMPMSVERACGFSSRDGKAVKNDLKATTAE